MVPRRLCPAQALTDCARQPRLSLGSPAEIQEWPFKRRRARPALSVHLKKCLPPGKHYREATEKATSQAEKT